ncbi:MAG: hypothetical protein AAGF91_17120, partial [Actinomycetota bacterium]
MPTHRALRSLAVLVCLTVVMTACGRRDTDTASVADATQPADAASTADATPAGDADDGTADAAATDDTAAQPPQDTAPPDPGTEEILTEFDGLTRAYTLHTPADAPADAPMVIFLHGSQGSMGDIGQTAEDWYDLSDQHGFLLVLPNGYDPRENDGLGDAQQWNGNFDDRFDV